MTIQELMEKRAKVWEAAKNFVDTHENENGVLSAEDSAAYERMEAEIEDLTKAIDRHRKAKEMEKNLNQPVNQPLTGKPYAGGQGEPKTGRASDEYRRAMLNALRSNFRQVSNTLQEGVDADGGYLVPEEYDRRLVDVLNEENIMRRLATRIVTSGEHKINIAATKPAASWIEEGGALTFGDATFDQKILDAHKLHVAIKVTEELLYDNGDKEVCFPVIVKEVSREDEEIWTDALERNAYLEETFKLQDGESDYRSFEEIKADTESNKILITSTKPVSRELHNKQSTDSIMREFTDNYLNPFIEQKMAELELEEEGTRNPDVKEYLLSYKKEDLEEKAKEFNITCSGSTKEELAEEIAKYVLSPEGMREIFLQADEWEADAFEAVLDKK